VDVAQGHALTIGRHRQNDPGRTWESPGSDGQPYRVSDDPAFAATEGLGIDEAGVAMRAWETLAREATPARPGR
jgi:hypothetical protein